MNSIKIFKIGGNVVDSPEALERFLDEFAAAEGLKALIHGGGKEATRLSKRLEIPTTMTGGRRVTDRATLDVVTMVYAGLINKRIVAGLQARGCDAIGLTGADAHAITATRRSPEPVDYGYVGDIGPDGVDTSRILSFLKEGLTPVFCAICCDGKGGLLNCNADSVASAVAKAMARRETTDLIYCFEKAGVLRDVDDPASVIAEITRATFDTLRAEGVIADGMIPKVENALNAVDCGVRSVTIRSSEDINIPSGTKITK